MSSKALVEHALSQLATHHHGPKPRRTDEDDVRPRCAPRALEDILLAKTDWWVGARARRQCSSIAHRLSVLPRVHARRAHTRVRKFACARERPRSRSSRVCLRLVHAVADVGGSQQETRGLASSDALFRSRIRSMQPGLCADRIHRHGEKIECWPCAPELDVA